MDVLAPQYYGGSPISKVYDGQVGLPSKSIQYGNLNQVCRFWTEFMIFKLAIRKPRNKCCKKINKLPRCDLDLCRSKVKTGQDVGGFILYTEDSNLQDLPITESTQTLTHVNILGAFFSLTTHTHTHTQFIYVHDHTHTHIEFFLKS